MNLIEEHHWLALCLVTESDRTAEWRYIAAVIQNRVLSRRYPDTYQGVILQKHQFSAFNYYTSHNWSPAATFRSVGKKQDPLLLVRACDHARDFVKGASHPLISPETMHYWSPVSMKPAGRKPAWASSATLLYTPPGVDPNRFVFAEGVA